MFGGSFVIMDQSQTERYFLMLLNMNINSYEWENYYNITIMNSINFTFISPFKLLDLLCSGYKSHYLGKSFICGMVAKVLGFSSYSQVLSCSGIYDIHSKC